MTLIKYSFLNLVLMLIFDVIWMKVIGVGNFYLGQLKPIARITEDGQWNVRLVSALVVYVVMAVALEVFVFENPAVKSLREYLMYGAFLGFAMFAVYDFTNRAIIDHYPVPMMAVDVFWGTLLFTATTYCHFVIRKQLNVF